MGEGLRFAGKRRINPAVPEHPSLRQPRESTPDSLLRPHSSINMLHLMHRSPWRFHLSRSYRSLGFRNHLPVNLRHYVLRSQLMLPSQLLATSLLMLPRLRQAYLAVWSWRQRRSTQFCPMHAHCLYCIPLHYNLASARLAIVPQILTPTKSVWKDVGHDEEQAHYTSCLLRSFAILLLDTCKAARVAPGAIDIGWVGVNFGEGSGVQRIRVEGDFGFALDVEVRGANWWRFDWRRFGSSIDVRSADLREIESRSRRSVTAGPKRAGSERVLRRANRCVNRQRWSGLLFRPSPGGVEFPHSGDRGRAGILVTKIVIAPCRMLRLHGSGR